MPVNDVIATDFNYMYKQGNSWENAVGDDTATTLGATNVSIGVYFLLTSVNYYINYRTFGAFDLSGLSGTVTGVSLVVTKMAGSNNLGLPFYVVRGSDNKTAGGSGGSGLPYTTEHYLCGVAGFDGDSYTYEMGGFTDGAGDGSYAEYTSEIAQTALNALSTNDAYTIDLNSTAVSDANSKIGTSNKFFIAIINKYDRSNTYTSDGSFPANSVASTQGNFVYPESDSTVSYRPFLRVTTLDTVVDEGVQFKTKILGGNLKITGGKVEIGR